MSDKKFIEPDENATHCLGYSEDSPTDCVSRAVNAYVFSNNRFMLEIITQWGENEAPSITTLGLSCTAASMVHGALGELLSNRDFWQIHERNK